MDTQKLSEILLSLKGEGTAASLARDIGISQQMLRLYLKNEGGLPKADKLQKIADYMGITLGELSEMLGSSPSTKTCEQKGVYNVFTAKEAYESVVGKLPNTEKLYLVKMIMNEAV
jgi:transcriptional regulator with XRE-family HTH domain